jgi:hypothetical protein
MHNFYNLNPNHQSASDELLSSISLDLDTPIDNDEFYRLFDAYCLAPDEKKQIILGHHLNEMNYLIGIILDEPQTSLSLKKGDLLKFLICSNDNREVFLPVFTDKTQVTSWYQEPINTLAVSASWLWNFVLKQKNYTGIVINPAVHSWTLNLDHIRSLLDDMSSST